MNLKINDIRIISFIAFILISFTSCYEHDVGCRDIYALNYNVKADLDCETECCSYPQMEIQISLLHGTETIDTNKYFPLDNGDSIRIKFMRIFFSDFNFTDADGKDIPVYKDILLGKRQNENIEYQTVNYSALKFKPESSQYNIGTTKTLTRPDKLSLRFGINDDINQSVMDKLTSSSPLYKGSDSMYIDETKGYYFMKMTIQSKKDPLLIRKFSSFSDTNNRVLIFYSDFDLSLREKHTVKFNIDLQKLFSGIDLDDDESVSSNKIVENIELSVALKYE